jgi:D-3-phosphoglycerate dehydrogenase
MPETARPVIFSTHALHPAAVDALKDAGSLKVATALDPATLIAESRDAAAIIVRAILPEAIFTGAPLLRAAVRHGAGLDMIPMEAATAAGVLVANVPAVNARSVAEHVFFVSMALLRRFRRMDRDLRTGGWFVGRAHAEQTNELSGRRIGIVGYGAVGRQVHAIAANGFGLDVAVTSRSRPEGLHGARFLDIDALVAASDILVLCCPLTPETRGLIDARRIGLMKPGALIVNVARGPCRWRGARRVRNPAAAAGSSLFRLRQCDRHASYGRDHRGKHDAHGDRRGRRSGAHSCRRNAGQSAQSGSCPGLSPPFRVR